MGSPVDLWLGVISEEIVLNTGAVLHIVSSKAPIPTGNNLSTSVLQREILSPKPQSPSSSLHVAVEEVPAVVAGSGKASAWPVRSGCPPEMPSRPSLESLCFSAAISRSPVAARPWEIIFSSYQVTTPLMWVPRVWREGEAARKWSGSSPSRWQSTCSPHTQP